MPSVFTLSGPAERTKRCALRWKKTSRGSATSPERWEAVGRSRGRKVHFTIERYGRGNYSAMMSGYAPITASSLKAAKAWACGRTRDR
jgi:hypothetical protein